MKTLLYTVLFILGITSVQVGIFFFREEYISWDALPLMIAFMLLALFGVAVITVLSVKFGKKPTVKKYIAYPVITSGIFLVLLWGLTFLINVVIGKEHLNVLAADVTSAILMLYSMVLVTSVAIKLTVNKPIKTVLCLLIAVLFVRNAFTFTESYIKEAYYKDYKAASPVLSEEFSEEEGEEDVIGDLYVSTKGSDENDGSKNAPFLTIEKAVETVRNTEKVGKDSITVVVEEGEYRVNSIVFTKEDSGTEDCPIVYRADGEVVLNGGVTLSSDDFVSVNEYPEIASRLSEDVQKNVLVLDLTKAPYSLSAEDWGKIYAIGSYNTASSYDGDYVGPIYCELFINDQRQVLARYPDDGFLLTEEVVSTGLGKESDGALTEVENWSEIRNPEPDVYKVNEELASRIGSWQTLDDVWMFGYWKYDWADASTLIGDFEEETGVISPSFVSLFGTKTDAPYYFFNVLEELTTAGEWYLDRENGLLCLYVPDSFDEATLDLSLSLSPIINSSADHITFDGFTVKGTRGDAINIVGDGNTVERCLIKNVAGNALVMTGSNNLAYDNEITHTGKGGIILSGGDIKTLTPGNNKADNNYIHDWSEIYLTYQPAVTLYGVGNICSHNNMAYSPHEAVTYSGNNHIIEYNIIHNVCLLSDDAGAIYAGRSWNDYGNVIRYNCIYDLGSDGHTPDGIYLDDALSGQQVYGNILINIPKLALHLGGGRDLTVKNNIVINAGKHAISYDSRARDGALDGGWFTHSSAKNGDMWQKLYNSPWQSEIWQNAFPQYKNCTDDFSQSETAAFIPNPANSTVSGNLIFDKLSSIGNISEAAEKFSDVSGNAIYPLEKADNFFTDPKNGDYSIKDLDKLQKVLPDFEEIPLEEIGRK